MPVSWITCTPCSRTAPEGRLRTSRVYLGGGKAEQNRSEPGASDLDVPLRGKIRLPVSLTHFARKQRHVRPRDGDGGRKGRNAARGAAVFGWRLAMVKRTLERLVTGFRISFHAGRGKANAL